MVHCNSSVKEPVMQGMWGIFEVFADTMVVCTMTALVVLTSGGLNGGVFNAQTGEVAAGLSDATLVGSAFNEVFGWGYWAPYLISLLASIIWNFTINRKITFKSASNVPKAMALVLLFYVIFTPASTILGDLAERAIGTEFGEYIVLAITMILNFILEFLYTRFIVYRSSCDTLPQKQKSDQQSSEQ
jgi:Na+/alanine symporter